MNTVIIGDIHGRDLWKKVVELEGPLCDFIFVGDYFDSFDILGQEQIDNFLDICQFARDNDKSVTLLPGNHDYHQYVYRQNTCSGYQSAPWDFLIREVLADNEDLFSGACVGLEYEESSWLISHAGVTKDWCEKHMLDYRISLNNLAVGINDLWKYRPLAFDFDGRDSGGNNTSQTPLWVRPDSLVKASVPFNQIFGHTQTRGIVSRTANNSKELWQVDCLLKEGEYLVLDKELLPIIKEI